MRACALEYPAGSETAPVVRAYAEGDAARRLIEAARAQGVEIQPGHEEALLLALKSVKVNTAIPAEIYLAVARIYAFLISRSHEKGAT